MSLGTYFVETYSFVHPLTNLTQTGATITYFTPDREVCLIEEFYGDVRPGYQLHKTE
jgi:hypothetical protein